MEEKDYLEREDIIINGSQASWEINMQGAIQGLYTGTFTFRCFLTPTQRLAASRMHRELLGKEAALASSHDDNLSFSLAQLKFRVLSAPPFWTSTNQANGMAGDLPDEDVIDAVLEAAIAAELKYKAQLKQKRASAIERAKQAAEAILAARDQENEGATEAVDDQP